MKRPSKQYLEFLGFLNGLPDGSIRDDKGQVTAQVAEALESTTTAVVQLISRYKSTGHFDRVVRGKRTYSYNITNSGRAFYLLMQERLRPAEPSPNGSFVDEGLDDEDLDDDGDGLAPDIHQGRHQKALATENRNNQRAKAAADGIRQRSQAELLAEYESMPTERREMFRERRILRRQITSQLQHIAKLKRRLFELGNSYAAIRRLYNKSRTRNRKLDGDVLALEDENERLRESVA